MKKRVLSFILMLVLLFGMIPLTAIEADAATYVVGNNVTVPNKNVPADGTNKYCGCGKSVGSGSHWCCWQYGYNVYYHIWGEYPNRYTTSTHYLRNVSAENRTLTVDHLKKYFRNAAPGALLRIDQDSSPTAGDNNGHTLVFVKMNSAGDGAFFLEGNYDGKGRSRLHEWKFSNLVSSYGAGSKHNYKYIKYICWPKAPEYVSCEHHSNKDLYNSVGVCTKCKEEYNFAASYSTGCAGYYKVNNKSNTISLRPKKPYSAADASTTKIKKGTQVEVLGSVKNHYGNTWYKVSYNGETGYANEDHLDFVKHLDQSITCKVTSPSENEKVPKKAFPVIGTITSKYPLQEVKAYIDGKCFATITLGKATSLDIRSSAINQNLDFAALSVGSHTLVIKARDIHRSSLATVCTRKFTTQSTTTSCSHSYSSSVTKQPTCTNTGVRTYSCTKCGASYTETIAATGHNYTSTVTPPTCNQEGYTTYTCTKCGYSYKSNYVDSYSHYYRETVVPPTCTKQGYTVWQCDCGDYYISNYTDPMGHDLCNWIITREPTCIERGLKERYCSRCTYAESVEIARADHNYYQMVVDPTCTTDGYIWHICAWCGEGYTTDRIPAYGHSYTKKVTKPTCTKEGYTTYTCHCGDTYVADRTAAVGHSYTKQVIAPTYTKQGYNKYTCHCGATYKDTYTRPLGLPTPDAKASNDTLTGKPVIFWTNDGEASYYEVYRATKKNGSYMTLGTTTKCSYTDADAAANKTYYYKVVAVYSKDASLNSGISAAVSGKCVNPQPKVSVSNNTKGYPVLKWAKISGAKKYEIWYATAPGGVYKKLTTTSSTTYTHSKASSGTTYYYMVRAYGKSKTTMGAFSDVVSATRKLSTPSLTTKRSTTYGKVTLKWGKISGASSYEIQCSVNGGEFQPLTVTASRSYVHTGLSAGNQYRYRVRALSNNESALGGYSKVKTCTFKCAKPQLSVIIDEATGKPYVTWNNVPGAKEYQLYVATSKRGKYKLAEVSGDNMMLYFHATAGKTYYFKVRAVDVNGNTSSYSTVRSIRSR